MLLERSQAGSAVCVSKMAAKADSDEEEIHTTADDELDAASELKTDIQTPTRRKTSEAFEVDLGEPMPEKPTNNLQEAFKKFKKQRQVGSNLECIHLEVFRVSVLWIQVFLKMWSLQQVSCMSQPCVFVRIWTASSVLLACWGWTESTFSLILNTVYIPRPEQVLLLHNWHWNGNWKQARTPAVTSAVHPVMQETTEEEEKQQQQKASPYNFIGRPLLSAVPLYMPHEHVHSTQKK